MSAQRWFMEVEPEWNGVFKRKRTYHVFRDRVIDGLPTRVVLTMPEPLFEEREALEVMRALNLADETVL